MKGTWLRRLVALTFLLFVVAAAYTAVTYRQDIIDWWRLRNYEPTGEVKALADAVTMHGRGRDVFYASDPKVDDPQTFNQHCTDTGEESLVLGCYKDQQIFIFNVSEPKLKGVKEVTAAHEMLHAAYERLGGSQKQALNALLQAELKKITDPRLKELIELYNKQEPGQLLNEMHSILGAEYRNLSPDLEQYYAQYFKDRSKTVALSEAYEAVFTSSKQRIAQYDQQLKTLHEQIEANTQQLKAQQAGLEAQNRQLSALRTTNPAAYNQAVPGYNVAVRDYNQLVAATQGLLAEYNQLVSTRNNEAAAQNDLYRRLDSNYQTIQAN